MNCLLWYGCFSADAVSLAEEKWFLLVAVTIYAIKIIIQGYHVFPGTLTADFTVCPFLLLALQNRFLTQHFSNQNELGKASRLHGPSHAHWTTSSLKLGHVWDTSQKQANDEHWMSPCNFYLVFLRSRSVKVLVFLAGSSLKDSFCFGMNESSGRSAVFNSG